jgi:hypothetical protein
MSSHLDCPKTRWHYAKMDSGDKYQRFLCDLAAGQDTVTSMDCQLTSVWKVPCMTLATGRLTAAELESDDRQG